MKSLKQFITETEGEDIYVVYFDDNTMYNYYPTEEEANKVKDELNKETKVNKCQVKKEKRSSVEIKDVK